MGHVVEQHLKPALRSVQFPHAEADFVGRSTLRDFGVRQRIIPVKKPGMYPFCHGL